MAVKSEYQATNQIRQSFGKHTRRTGAIVETYPRHLIGGSALTLTSQTQFLTAISINEPITVTNITFMSSSTALSGQSNWWFALYDSSLNLVEQTADQANGGSWGANSEKTLALATPKTIQPGLYYAAVMVNATQPPTILSLSLAATIVALAPILGGTSDASLTTTAPATATAITGGTRVPWVWLS